MSDNPVSRLPPPPLTPTQQEQLLDMRQHIKNWIAYFGKKFRNLLELEDIAQIVKMASAQAVRTWRAECNVPVEMYAWKHVNGAVTNAARKQLRQRDVVRAAAEKCMNYQRDDGDRMKETEAIVRKQVHDLTDRAVTAMIFCLANESSVDDAMAGEDGMAERQMQAKLRRLVASSDLVERERAVLELVYVKDCEVMEIAETMKIGGSSARRIHNEALTTLRERFCVKKTTESGAVNPAARDKSSEEPDKGGTPR